MGGRVDYAVSGGAPLDARLAHFMRGIGVPVLEGWGLTETTAGVTLNLPAAQRIGSVGRPLPGCEVRIADDGEVLVKSVTVCQGYWRDDTTVTEVRDADGWFRTGDLGELRDGYLVIVGRKKDLIVTASGKNVAPALFEGRLGAHWLIDQCVVVGDDRPYVGALLTLDPAAFADWKATNGRAPDATVAQLRGDADLNALLQRAVDEVNRLVSRAEAIKRFRILPGQFDVGDELTTTQNVRRQYVLNKFGVEVEALYAAA
jgi:long-chain acyl-CoA synthetase